MTPSEIRFVNDVMARTQALLDRLTTPEMVGLHDGAPRNELEAWHCGARFMAMSFIVAEIVAGRPEGTTAADVRVEIRAHLEQVEATPAAQEAVH